MGSDRHRSNLEAHCMFCIHKEEKGGLLGSVGVSVGQQTLGGGSRLHSSACCLLLKVSSSSVSVLKLGKALPLLSLAGEGL